MSKITKWQNASCSTHSMFHDCFIEHKHTRDAMNVGIIC